MLSFIFWYLILAIVSLIAILIIVFLDKKKYGTLLEKTDPTTNQVYYEYEKSKEKSDPK